jgi:serine/threonine protein kinase
MDISLPAAAKGRSGRIDLNDLLIRLIKRDGRAIEELTGEGALAVAKISRVLVGLAGDPISFEMGYGCRPDAFYREISAVYRDLAEMAGGERQKHDELRGFLGFICFTMIALKSAAERGNGPATRGQSISEMQSFLTDPPVRDLFHALYRPSGLPEPAGAYWKSLQLDSLEVYRVGTTSFILKCRVAILGGETRALKCLLFPYSKIRGIADATLRYVQDYPSGKVPCTVPVYSSTDKWILMDFAAGRTLQEVLSAEQTGEGVPRSAIRASLLASISPHLLDVLYQLHDAGFEHRDLTPSNIIVVAKPDIKQPNGKVVCGEIERLVLIDLGRNYLFAHQSGVAENREAGFVAPEVKVDKPAASSDMYSLGMILTEVADPKGALDGIVPDSIYRYAPYLARFIEDLIDVNPDNRLLIFDQGAGSDTYNGLRSIFA